MLAAWPARSRICGVALGELCRAKGPIPGARFSEGIFIKLGLISLVSLESRRKCRVGQWGHGGLPWPQCSGYPLLKHCRSNAVVCGLSRQCLDREQRDRIQYHAGCRWHLATSWRTAPAGGLPRGLPCWGLGVKLPCSTLDHLTVNCLAPPRPGFCAGARSSRQPHPDPRHNQPSLFSFVPSTPPATGS